MLINQAECAVKESNETSEAKLMEVEHVYWAEMCQALERLENNPDFKKVVLEGYFKDKAINGVSLLATEHVRRNGLRGPIMEELVAISQLEDYFITIKGMGRIPDDSDLDDDEIGED